MKCFACSLSADLICPCKNIPLCKMHAKYHKYQPGHENLERLNIYLSKSESQAFKKEVVNRLKQIQKSKNQISSLIQTITLKLHNSSEKAFKELESLRQYYLNLLNYEKLSASLKLETERIVSSELKIREVLIDIDQSFESAFCESLFLFPARDVQEKVQNNQSEVHEIIYNCKGSGKSILKKRDQNVSARIHEIRSLDILNEKEANERKKSFENKTFSKKMFWSILVILSLFSLYYVSHINAFNLFEQYCSQFNILNLFGQCSSFKKFNENKKFLESLDLFTYNEYFGRDGEYNYQVDEILLSDDGLRAFICKNY